MGVDWRVSFVEGMFVGNVSCLRTPTCTCTAHIIILLLFGGRVLASDWKVGWNLVFAGVRCIGRGGAISNGDTSSWHVNLLYEYDRHWHSYTVHEIDKIIAITRFSYPPIGHR